MTDFISKEVCHLQSKVSELNKQALAIIRDRSAAQKDGAGDKACNSVCQLRDFQQKLEQMRCLVCRDTCQVEAVNNSQKKLLCDLQAFLDILRQEEKKLQMISFGGPPCNACPQSCTDLCPPPCCDPCPCPQCRPPSCQSVCSPVVCVAQRPCAPFCVLPQVSSYCCGSSPCFVCEETCEEKSPCCLPSSCSTYLRVCEVHPIGKYIKLVNTSCSSAEDIGGHFLVQMVDGQPLSSFRFPLRAIIYPQSSVKVWSSCYDPGMCRSTTDHVFKQLLRWCSSNEVITSLCKPMGEVVAWLEGCNSSICKC